MKHNLLTGYFDGYNFKIEEKSSQEIKLGNIIAIKEIYNYFLGSIALVNNNFLIQGEHMIVLEKELTKMSKDIYVKKKYGNLYFRNEQDDLELFLKKLYESFYIGMYQDFETYIAQTIKCILWFNPDLLGHENKNKFLKYTGKNVLTDRENFLERYISSVMMKSDIIATVNFLMNLVEKNVKDVLDVEGEKTLKHIGLNRNLIVHNSGVVTALYLRKLKDSGLSVDNLKLGRYIFEGCENQSIIVKNDISDFIYLLVKKINKIIEAYFE